MEYTYYELQMFENREDDCSTLPYKGRVKGIKLLKFNGDDKGLNFGDKIEDESLAMQILLQNLQQVELTFLGSNDLNVTRKIGEKVEEIKNEKDLQEIIFGKYEKIFVSKYKSTIFC